MSLQSVYDQIIRLGATKGSNAKKELLATYLHDDLFVKVCQAALDSRRSYHIKALPKYRPPRTETTNTAIFRFLDVLNEQPGSSNADKQHLATLASIDPATWQVVQWVVKKDLRCGVGVKTINSVVPETVFDIPYCRCSKEDKLHKITYPAIAQEKADGMFCNMFVSKEGKIKFLSRDGILIKQLTKLRKSLEKDIDEGAYDHVIHGELRVMNEDGITLMERTKGNGILNSCIHGTANQRLADNVVLHAWDIIPTNKFWAHHDPTPYYERLNFIDSIVTDSNIQHVFALIETVTVTSEEKARLFYAKLRALGAEGVILKDYNAPWKYHTSPLQIKLKNVIDIELLLVGWAYGKEDTKYEHCVGALICETRCGKLEVNIGTGLSDEERGYRIIKITGTPDFEYAQAAMDKWDTEIGNIIQGECESVIKSKVNKKYSLYLPRYLYIRRDKTKADSLHELLQAEIAERTKGQKK